jgi:RNA polymerase sigma-70 factor (ECF subfamily)
LSYTDISSLTEPLASEPERSPESLVLQAEGNAVLREGLLALSERERTALLLRDVDGMSSRDVAQVLQCSEATVRSHIANARIKFRRFLERRKA